MGRFTTDLTRLPLTFTAYEHLVLSGAHVRMCSMGHLHEHGPQGPLRKVYKPGSNISDSSAYVNRPLYHARP